MKKVALAFSGSGFLAPFHIGAAAAFMDAEYKIVETAGTSGGSIVAAAIASGKDKQELLSLMYEDTSDLLSFEFLNLLSSKNYCSGKRLSQWLDKAMQGATFASAIMPCTIMTTDVSALKGFEFSKKATPNTPLYVACRASSAVPFIYNPVVFDGKVLVDGGLINNIPVSFLKKGVLRVGIDIDDSGKSSSKPIIPLASTLLSILLSSNENSTEMIAKQTGAKIVRIKTSENFLNCKMSTGKKQAMFDRAYNETGEFIKSLNS